MTKNKPDIKLLQNKDRHRVDRRKFTHHKQWKKTFIHILSATFIYFDVGLFYLNLWKSNNYLEQVWYVHNSLFFFYYTAKIVSLLKGQTISQKEGCDIQFLLATNYLGVLLIYCFTYVLIDMDSYQRRRQHYISTHDIKDTNTRTATVYYVVYEFVLKMYL